MHLNHAKLIWDRLSDLYKGHRTRHDQPFEDYKESLKKMTFTPEPSSSSSCYMARGDKVTECYLSETSDDESGDEFGPSYVKLASLATKQQRALEKIQNMLSKSDDMLGEEMDQSKALAESLQRLHSKFDALQDQHNALLSDHEKLSSECLQRNQDLEKIRVDYGDLQKERDSFLLNKSALRGMDFNHLV